MATPPLLDFYNSRISFDKLNPLIRSAYNTTSDFEEYKQKLLKKVELDNCDGKKPFIDTIEDVRQEQRVRLAQVEHEYYHQKITPPFDVPFYAEETTKTQETVVTSKPPLPVASRRSPSPKLQQEEQIQHHIHCRPASANVIQRHDDDTSYCPHYTCTTNADVIHDSRKAHIQQQIQTMWDEYELDDYLEKRKTRRIPSAPPATTWAGRVTVPEPFSLTDSVAMSNIHRKKCIHELEAAKLQKEVDDELIRSRTFKAKPVPAHVRMPLYEQLREEQRIRREQVRQMTKEYLDSISKPFGFQSRTKSQSPVKRRHSYSDGDTARYEPQFKAKPLPDFYYRTSKEIEEMKEKSLYRTIKREIRAKELLRQSRLPINMKEREENMRFKRRSRSANDLTQTGLEECTFKPKTNGHFIPDYDRLHASFVYQSERAKRVRSPTKCKPFLLHTTFIAARKDKVLDDIRYDEEMRHLQTFQIKGKQFPTKSNSGMSLSTSLQQPEAIPTKTTQAQRTRESMSKKKRRDDEARDRFEAKFQRSRSAKGRRLSENIREQARTRDRSAVHKARKDENIHKIRQSIQQNEQDYARKINIINSRVQRRPLLLEQNQRDKEIRDLEREIQHAMRVAKITEDDLKRQKFNPPDVKVTGTRTNYAW